MPGYAFASRPGFPALFSVQEKHFREPLGLSDLDQLAAAVALGQPSFKKPRHSCRPVQRRRILLDIMETGEVFEVKADMPGVGKHNIKVDIDGDVLTLSVSPPQNTERFKGHTAAQCPCGDKCACNPCTCTRTATPAPTPAATAAPMDHGTPAHDAKINTAVRALHAQQAQCPCGDKCSCDPCNCTASDAGLHTAGAGAGAGAGAPTIRKSPLATQEQPSAKGGSAKATDKPAATWQLTERARRFQRRAIRIPETADTSNVSASYVDGVLTVTFRKVVLPSKQKRIVVV